MSAYGHTPPYSRGDHDPYQGHDAYDGYADSYAGDSYGQDPYPADPYGEPTRAASTGRASAGRARVAARATVPPAGVEAPADPPETRSGHRYDWSGAGAQRPAAGRASVPVSPAVGGASGRATVRPGGPTKPGGPAGAGPGGEGRPKRKKKRHWIRNSLLGALALIIITTGGGMVALSYYVDSVPPPDLIDLAEGSTVVYSDGREMAVLQEVNREIIDTKLPELANVRNAVVAAEDKGFWDHSGVDFMGIARAAFNNFTGGEQQGASTIDQQYAGAAAEIRGDESYSRKLEEAAMAYKMNQDYEKEDILDFYLNTIYFGRGAYGVQAAAEAYFEKPAAELTFEEAAVMAGCIRLPDDGSGLCPYDPLRYPEDQSAAELRFRYVLGQAVEMGELDQATADAMQLPEVIEPPDPDEPFKDPEGNIVRHVQRELEAMGITDVATGGYRITTTIDRKIQGAARDAARHRNRDSDAAYWQGVPEEISSGLVAIDPNTGGVLAYYGGEDGTGFDHAGPNYNEADELLVSGREPGSTMKIYTLIAALRAGVSFDTHWQTSEFTPPWRDQPVTNAGRRAEQTGCEGQAPDFCTLRWSTIQSYNSPFIHMSAAMGTEAGPQNIVQAAMDAGIRTMVDNDGVIHDLTAIEDVSEVAPSNFFHEVAIGQYPITVLDHANGVATLAARGVYHEAHFVATVERKENGEWVPVAGDQVNGEQRVQTEHADAITGVLSQIPGDGIMGGNALANGRPAAAKTGTWEHDNGGNKDAWVVGYTPQIATAVWVGEKDGAPITTEAGASIGSSGLPAQIWKQFMDAAHAEKEWENTPFPPAPPVGDPNSSLANGVQPEPEEDEDDPRCRGPFTPFCPDDEDDNGGNDGGDNNNNDDDTNGGLVPINPPGFPDGG